MRLPAVAGYDKLFSGCWAPAIGQLIAPLSCADANYKDDCLTSDGEVGHCSGGVCKVGGVPTLLHP